MDEELTFFEQLSESTLLTNPLNAVLLLVALYLLLSLLTPYSITNLTPTLSQARSPARNPSTSYSYLPDLHPPCVQWKRYTPRTLAVYDGSGFSAADKNGSMDVGAAARKRGEPDRILLAIQGKVFDVTKGANFYGPGESALSGVVRTLVTRTDIGGTNRRTLWQLCGS